MLVIPISLQRHLLRTRFSSVRNCLLGKPLPTRQSEQIVGKVVTLFKAHQHASVHAKSAKLQKGTVVTNLIESKKPILGSSQLVNNQKESKSLFNALKSINTLQKTSTNFWKQRASSFLFLFFIVSTITILSILFIPVVYYKFFSHETIPVQTTDSGTPMGGEFDKGTQTPSRQVAQPAYDENLPEGNWLIIPRIGVRTEILEGETSDEALQKGVWRVPDFGQAGDLNKPIILAAHRYGYNWWWKGQYWKYHSFYLLPQLQPGDLVEVISGKRKYIYEIYSGEEGEEISDYDADMILYTCKFLNSPLRHFRYARLIDPNTSTQETLTSTINPAQSAE